MPLMHPPPAFAVHRLHELAVSHPRGGRQSAQSDRVSKRCMARGRRSADTQRRIQRPLTACPASCISCRSSPRLPLAPIPPYATSSMQAAALAAPCRFAGVARPCAPAARRRAALPAAGRAALRVRAEQRVCGWSLGGREGCVAAAVAPAASFPWTRLCCMGPPTARPGSPDRPAGAWREALGAGARAGRTPLGQRPPAPLPLPLALLGLHPADIVPPCFSYHFVSLEQEPEAAARLRHNEQRVCRPQLTPSDFPLPPCPPSCTPLPLLCSPSALAPPLRSRPNQDEGSDKPDETRAGLSKQPASRGLEPGMPFTTSPMTPAFTR